MSSSTSTSNNDPQRADYINARIEEYGRREANLNGRKITFLRNENQEWRNNCQFYATIALLVLLLVTLVVVPPVIGYAMGVI